MASVDLPKHPVRSLRMRIDHLVWFCADLDDGKRYFAETMDCPPAYGGCHSGEGTRNSLLSLGAATYLEILAHDPAQDESSVEPELLRLTGPGLYHWASGGADLSALRINAIAAGLDASDIVTGGRALPSGARLGWKLFGIRNHRFGALVPFFIDWTGSEHPASTAPRGGSLANITVASPEPEKLRETYRVLGIEMAVAYAATPGLAATITTRKGDLVLRMVDPVPRGFVI